MNPGQLGTIRAPGHNAWLSLLLACCLLCAAQAAADPRPAPAGRYLEDAGGELDWAAALQRFRDGGGSPVENGRFNLGNTDSRFWLYFRIHNTTGQPEERVLDFGVPYRAHLAARLYAPAEDPEAGRELFVTGEWEVFHEREAQALTLHTPPFTLPAGGAVEILLDYRTRGSTYMPVTVKTADAFLQEQRSHALRSAFFYAASFILLLVFFMLGVALRNVIVLLYAGLFVLGLLFLAAMEGYAYQYLWPRMPRWNQYASLCLLLLAAGSSFMVARVALAPSLRRRWLDFLLLALGALSLALAVLCAALPFAPIADFASLLVALAAGVQLVTIGSWLTQALRRNLVSLATALLVAPLTIALVLLGWLGFDLPDIVMIHGARLTYFVSVILTLGALATHVLALHSDHERSLQEALVAAQRDAELSRALYESRREYERVQHVAQRWRRHYAETSHDIRQPLTSIRAAMASGSLHSGTPEWANLARSLEYLEELSRPGHGIEQPGPHADAAAEREEEPYPADLVLDTIRQMFEAEAVAASTRLRCLPCSRQVAEPPLVLMRILSNLAVNALRHAPGGRVVLGCRRSGDALRFEVIDDGPGMSESELARLQKPYEKGAGSGGEGLGLAICWQLAADYGYTLSVRSRPGRGTRFTLQVPAPAGQASIGHEGQSAG